MEDLKVSVVVTVLNEAAGTSALLIALTQQKKIPDEIIVVDGGSTDGTPEAVEKFIQAGHAVWLLKEPGCNISKGRNVGIKSARYDIIACTDAGCVPENTWLVELTEPFSDAKVAVVGGACQADSRSRLEQVIGLMTVPGELSAIEPASYNPSARNIAFRKSVWRRAGGFPEWLYTAEDTLFDCQLRKLGVGFSFAPKAKVLWRPRQTLSALCRQISGYARGEGHIGRAGSSARFWRRRYSVTVFLLSICLVSAYVLASGLLVAVGIGAAAILLIIPIVQKAFQVMNKTGRITDFPLAAMVGQVMALADAVGFTRGTSQRLSDPEKFIKPLKAYWGEPAVVHVPKWQLVNPRTPRTLIVSWHWAPNGRACANVLSNLFVSADQDVYSVITRAVPLPQVGDTIANPSIPTHRISWPAWCTHESGFVFTIASIVSVLRMIKQALLLHRERKVDRIIAVCPHRFSLLAGLLISMFTGTKLVLYMHDLLAESLAGQGVIRRALWRMIDRFALNRAWFIVVPTREFAAHYRKRGLSHTLVIPHCMPTEVSKTQKYLHQPDEYPNSNVAQKAQSDLETAQAKACGSGKEQSLKLVYTGKVYEAHEDAIRALVATTDSLASVELSLLSNAHAATQAEQSTWLSRRQALRAIEQADVGVVALGMSTPYPSEIDGCFPSKIIDYLAAGRPILAVVPPGCFVERFVRESGCGVTVDSFSAVDIRAAIEELIGSMAREKMAKAALAVRNKLASADWLDTLSRKLTIGPATPMAWPIVSKQASDTNLKNAKSSTFEQESGVSL